MFYRALRVTSQHFIRLGGHALDSKWVIQTSRGGDDEYPDNTLPQATISSSLGVRSVGSERALKAYIRQIAGTCYELVAKGCRGLGNVADAVTV
jgi:hypothetical protein